jgi:hypothetical protein
VTVFIRNLIKIEIDLLTSSKNKVCRLSCFKERIERDNFEKRPSNWLPVSSAGDCFSDFPKLQEDDLCQLTLEVYQLKLAKSFTIEHLSADHF